MECIDLATLIRKVTFKHCFLDANVAAHELARFKFYNKRDDSWSNEPPGFLIRQLVNNVIDF